MSKGQCELRDVLKEKFKKLSFFDFYIIFRDLLLGITNMNSNYLTHGDVKPSNILYFNGLYCLCDYGTGRNLFYESRNANQLFFQVGFWTCKGTPNYCDPIIKKELNKRNFDPKYEIEKVYHDLFKNDIYQTGVTCYEIATGKSVVGINEPKFD